MRECFDVKRKGKDRLTLVPTARTFREMWKGGAKTALFAQKNNDYAPEIRYELYAVAGVDCPTHADIEKMQIICPECGAVMKRVGVPQFSNSVIRDFGEYRCQPCYLAAWDREREARRSILALRESMGAI